MSIIKAFQIVNEYCRSSTAEYLLATRILLTKNLISDYSNHSYLLDNFEFINHTFGINYEK